MNAPVKGFCMFAPVLPSSFEAQTFEFDLATVNTPDISTVCTGSDWQIAASQTLHEKREYIVRQNRNNWLLMALGPLAQFHKALQPLEFSWGFSSPLVGAETHLQVELLAETLQETDGCWEIAVLGGIPAGSKLWHMLKTELSARYHVEFFQGANCMVGDLSKGADHYISKRSARFRSNLRRNARKSEEEGISFEWSAQPNDGWDIIKRAIAVEQKSWKYESEASIFQIEQYKLFYTHLLKRMGQRGRLRALFAQQNEEDVAYVFGGVMGDVYRGFQIGYDENLAKLGLGHLLQWKLIQKLAQEGIRDYDLGMEMDYKKQWTDRTLVLHNIAIFPDP